MKPKITLKAIAKEFGVSISTVSKSLKNSNEISLEMRERIQAFANYYNYRPNSFAIKLRNQKTLVLGVVIPEITHHFFSKVISGVEQAANQRGYNVMVCLSNESHQKEMMNVAMLANGSVDGLLVSIANETQNKRDFKHFQELIDEEIPFVLFDRVEDTIACDKVVIDDVKGGYNATKYLIDTGAKRVGMLTTPDYVDVGYKRKVGYEKAIEEAGLPVDESLILKVNKEKDIAEQINSMIDREDHPDAIFAVNEIYAAIAIKTVQSRGMNVPNDIAVIGFTDGLVSQYASPSITTMEQHGFTMGMQAANMLVDRLESDVHAPYTTKVVSTSLKVRASTKKE
ncbi:LacI family DNA-binding transcriptional regulator [Flavicella marina]|uniref:LacI family DNA-binding transcriptional regulator n=1 Tax=Flavicella marina TaxID=1475951 RepID=UPI00126449A4|nr:LacI family DNA-binding transcriptional regulator [Flavicella marina]